MMYLRWLFIQAFYWFCVLISVFVWPVTYPFHKWVKSKRNPIYWLIHNSPMGYDWYWTKFGIPLGSPEPTGLKRFWISYNWSVLRNGCWRLFNTVLKQPKGERTNVEIVRHEIYDNKSLSAFTLLRMKFKTNGVPTDNVGTEFDLEKSFQGKNHIKYKVDGTKYFMYSYCKIEGNKGIEFTIGWNGSRPLIRHKRKIK